MSRPVGVTIIAVLVAINGIVGLIGAFAAMVAGEQLVAAFVTLLFGLVLLYLAWGLWTLRPWAWLGTVAIMGLNAVFALVQLFFAPGAVGLWINLLLAVVVIAYLLRPETRGAFGRRAGV